MCSSDLPGDGGRKSKKGDGGNAVLLFDVSKDPKETTDLAAQQPERVAKMTAALKEWKTSVENSLAGKDYPAGTFDSTPAVKKAKKKAETVN